MGFLVEGLLRIIRYWCVSICHNCRDKRGKLTSSWFFSIVFTYLVLYCLSLTASIFTISIQTQTLFVSFILAHFPAGSHPVFLPRSRTTQTAVPVCSSCSPAVAWVCVTLFPHGYEWGSPHRDPSNPLSFSLAPFFPHVIFLLPAHALKESERGWLLCPVQVSRVGEKGCRGCGCLPSRGGGYSVCDPPPVAGLDPHESASHSCAIQALLLNAITLCVARYTQGTWQSYNAGCSSWVIHT